MISFVFYFHSTRIDNLKQTLRFLFKREKFIGEVLLICNDSTEQIFENCTVHNLNLNSYKKPTMCNYGVNLAKFEVVVLLDSDRILPPMYFSNNLKKINKNQFVSCCKLKNLKTHATDEEIEKDRCQFDLELKSLEWEIRKKNLFSGNTMFFKRDYLDAGGMDESFEGYGFADNDMTINVLSKKYKAVWNDDFEVHLYHNSEILYDNKIISSKKFRKKSQNNLIKFLKKWNLFEFHKKDVKICLL